MNNNTKAISFWNFLKENTIEIPIIQRDYAQGRLGKESLRKNFLCDLKNALEAEDTIEMKLDFVYGSTEKCKMNPLDGQQRLTTLWLLHWYIALRAGMLNEENCKIFQRFTYETRISSREFCENLCNPKHFEKFDGNDIVGFITKQTWFYSAWKQDPTIQSMLRMLGGTKINDKNGEDIIDGIEELFDCPSECDIIKNTKCLLLRDFHKYWNKMTSDDCPIVFYHLSLQDFGLSDELYIKMNARGKQLTSFENFKADLIGYITKQSENEQDEWKELLAPESGIPIKMDTDWTDIFWNNKSKDYKIDEIYFAFLNRYILNELICQKHEIKTEEKIEVNYAFTAEYLEKESNKFKYLYGDKGNDSKLEYKDLGDYLYYLDGIPFELFVSLQNTLNNYYNKIINVNDYFPEWVVSNFEFIPCYNDEGISILGQKERIVFLAVCRYFENNSFDDKKFKQWMRVVWNIVENSGVETISAMVGVMRLLDELSIHSHDIYYYLENDNNVIKSKAANDQVKEERAKAKQILKNEELWEPLITTAEVSEYLKGKIAALFNVDEAGSFLLYDDDNAFKKRYEIINEISSDKEDKYHFIKIILSYCDKETPWANLNLSEFKSCLNDAILINCFRVIDKNEINPDIRYQWIEQLVNTQVLNNSRGKYLREGKPYLFATEGRTWNAYGNVILDKMHCNNTMFSNLANNGSIQTNHKVNNCDCFWGWDINFKYRTYFFRWNGNNNFYLMEDNWKSFKKRPIFTEEMSDDDKFYMFKINNMNTSGEFTLELDYLISQAFPEESDKACCNDCQNKVCE
jgi:hypothetical protein